MFAFNQRDAEMFSLPASGRGGGGGGVRGLPGWRGARYVNGLLAYRLLPTYYRLNIFTGLVESG